MARLGWLGVLAGISWLAGCSIYPLPEDVTGFESKHIVRVTRCQARDAVRAEIQRTLADSRWSNLVIFKRMTGAETAEWLRSNPENYRELKLRDFAPQAARLYRFYGDTSISYDFTIDSTEMNTAGFDVSLVKALTRGSDALGVTARNDRTRQVKRQFRNYDSFDNLARNLPNEYCAGVPDSANPLYPATGLTKIHTLVRDFVDQNQRDNLGAKDSALNAEMNDTITFSTKFTGNVAPTFRTNAIPGVFVPSELSMNLDNSRLDVHTIIILVRLPNDRSKIVQFDATGNISSIGQTTIDERFREIRDNNFRDDFSRISTNVSRLAP